MNFDKLIKLAKLAHNNPYEHEKHSAAELVCKMIVDAEKELLQLARVNPIPANQSRPVTWNDVKRSEEPEFRSTPPKQSDFRGFSTPYTSHDWMKDWFTNPRTGQKWENPYVKYREGSWESPKQEPPKQRPEVQKRKCVQCGSEVDTRNINNVFVCNPCQWTAWEKTK